MKKIIKKKQKRTKKSKKSKKITWEKVFIVIERVIDHKIFRPIAIAILVSFALFNGALYVKNYVADYQEKKLTQNLQTPIEIKIKKGGKILDFDQMQIVERRVKSGDTILDFLSDLEVEEKDVLGVLSALRKIYNPRSIVVGNSMVARYLVKIEYDEGEKSFNVRDRHIMLSEFEIIISPELQYVVKRVGDGVYQAEEVKQVLNMKLSKYVGVIKEGLFLDAIAAGASPNAVMNMIALYAYDIDFARDIRPGNEFEILVESYYTENGRKVRDGNILFSLMKMKRREVKSYAYRLKGNLEYFDEKGRSTRKSLLRTPVNGARVSSGFGMRRHPVLGYSKLHKGIDFAAPRGTPILAAGDGKIVYRARYGSYGNFMRIRHSSGYDTAYAHISRFSNRFRNGSQVKQGDVIAYVGTTGRSTGPHLHFEVRKNGRVINPKSVKSVSGMTLKGGELTKFNEELRRIEKARKDVVRAR